MTLPAATLETEAAIPVSTGALIFDRRGRLLIVKPTYKSGWTIPGGIMEADGETPWQACKREVREECGIEVLAGRLAAVDFRRPKPGWPGEDGRPGRRGGLRILFDCGALPDSDLAAITLQADELEEHRFVTVRDALALLRGPIRRRVRAACAAKVTVYLEDGRRVRQVA